MSLIVDLQTLDPGAIVEMFEIDLVWLGGSVLRFHSGVNALGGDLVWQGNTYFRYPIMADGYEKRGANTSPKPTLTVSNIGGVIGGLLKSYDDLVGAKVTRKRTFVKYLDDANWAVRPAGTTATPTVFFPDEVYYVERKTGHNRQAVKWEMSSALDLRGVKVPLRQVIQNTCPWEYRGDGCGYTGGPVAKSDDTATAVSGEDVCGKRLASCELRFGADQPLPFGGFPGVGLYRG